MTSSILTPHVLLPLPSFILSSSSLTVPRLALVSLLPAGAGLSFESVHALADLITPPAPLPDPPAQPELPPDCICPAE